jgi:hypothetical protein
MTAIQLTGRQRNERDAFPVLISAPCALGSIARTSRDTAIRSGIWLPACFATMQGAAMSPCISAASKTRHCRCPAPVSPCAAQCRSARPSRSRLEPAAVRGEANRALRFFNFVKAELGRFDLHRVDQSLVDRFARSLRLAGLRPVAAADLLRVIFDLHELRHHLPTARLPLSRGRAQPVLGGRCQVHRRREPDAAHSRRDHHAAAGLVAALRDPLRWRYPRRARGA